MCRWMCLRGKRIAVIGFGSQGRAQALNLRDGGFDVVVGLRRGSRSFPAVEQCGLRAGEIGDVVRESGVIMLLVPDEVQPEVFAQDIGTESEAWCVHWLCSWVCGALIARLCRRCTRT